MILAGPMKAAAACREGAASVRSGPELPNSYAEELDAIAARLDALSARMTADLNDRYPTRDLPEWDEVEGPEFEDDVCGKRLPRDIHILGEPMVGSPPQT